MSTAAASKNSDSKSDRSGVLVRRLLRDHVRPYKSRIVFALVCMVIVAGATAAMAYLMEPILDEAFQGRDLDALKLISAAVLLVFVVKGFAAYGQSVAMNYVGQRIIADLRARMFGHVIRADLAFFHDHAAGALISRFTNDVNLLNAAVSNALVGMGKNLLTVVFLVALMFYQDWVLALVAFVAFPTAVLPIVHIGRRLRKVSASTQAELGNLTTLLSETIQGARHVKAYGMEAHETRRVTGSIDTVFALIYKATRTRAIASPVMETLGGVAIVGVLLYGGHQVMTEVRTPGMFFSFITALLLAYEPMKRLANLNANLQEGLAAAERIFALLDTRPRVVDRPGAKDLEIRRGRVRLDNVRFAYLPGRPALDGITIDVPAGKTVALVGPSGAGKSTVLNLIPRFYDADSGRVLIDGTDVREVTLATLRAAIGLVSQDIGLFDDTVRNNIAYGKPEAGEDEIIAAARHAAAHEFIEKLPEGYETRVGGRGLKLSGGQRQRIAIARAMLKGAPILLLDEATSALDTESERQVQAALAELRQGRTTMVISQRLSTVLSSYLIYVIEEGKIVEKGNHAQLLAKGGRYARLYAMQLADDRVAEATARRARA
ncbi:MAG: ABC transporter transmembrane domain-containing protein [Alphaproteobacteria bacterium]